ncbi:MAG TPA: bifunctional phosphoribosyl-AMP cyclohydrolase/phosphoribosyl-ATP diphosphatase HisIE, partial [Acidimicrobiales bacterium]|nr:bifunctional phosphoribosyl-AMP cyclohydrolase/phosphoribosyl-ATP diphosphatase HisIE [Acidimicrobiales bacterium]
DALAFDAGSGLVSVVAVDAASGRVLMVAHADREALERTLETGEMHYRSRTRGPWHKGATSGNVQHVVALVADCDGDAVLAVVAPDGPACHTGSVSCFDDDAAAAGVLGRLDALIARRADPTSSPATSYVRALLADRNLRLKKLGEEATELAVAAVGEDRDAVASEAADLLFHVMVATRAAGVPLDDVLAMLAGRERDD